MEQYLNSSDDEKSKMVKVISKSENSLGLSDDEIYVIQSDHYLNVDDDEYSSLGNAIFSDHDPWGQSINEVLEAVDSNGDE